MKRIQRKHHRAAAKATHRAQYTKPGGATASTAPAPQGPKVSAVPQSDPLHYSSIARCTPNASYYERRSISVPYEKLHALEARYTILWSNIDVQQYKGDFTEAAYIEKFGPIGKQLFAMMLAVRGAALPGDSSSTSQGAITAVHNTLSAILFDKQITPRDLQQLAGDLSDADTYTPRGTDRRLIARRELNARFQQLKIPMAFHITQLESIEAVCIKRYYK